MNDTKMLKKLMAIIYAGIIIYCGFLDFIAVPEICFVLKAYSVKGFYLVALAAISYVYFVYTGNSKYGLFSLIGAIVGYGITFVTIKKYGMGIGDFEIGCSAYFASILLFIIALIIPGEKTLAGEISKMNTTGTENIDMKDVDGDFFVCNYITGVKGAKDIYKSPSVLITKSNSDTLDIIIKAPEEIKLSIDNSSIEKIIINQEMKVNVTDVQKEDHTVETQYLATVLIGSFGPLVGERLARDKSPSTRTNFDSYFKIEIMYKTDEEHRLVFQTDVDPQDFFKKYDNILEFKQ